MGLSTADAARNLGVHQNTVSRYVARGLLGRSRRWYTLDRDEVEQLALDRWRPGHPYWMRTPEAAEVLGITGTRVKQLARAGRLPAVRHDGRWYFRRHQLGDPVAVVFWVAWPLCTLVGVAQIWDWWRFPGG